MQIDAPQLTQILNLLIAVGIFAGIAAGGLRWTMGFVLRGTERLIEPLAEKQAEMAEAQHAFEVKVEENRRELAAKVEASQRELAGKVEHNQKELTEAFSKLNSSVLGHESRLSFVEGVQTGRQQGWNEAKQGMPLHPQIPLEDKP
jgi:hypothetical protein